MKIRCSEVHPLVGRCELIVDHKSDHQSKDRQLEGLRLGTVTWKKDKVSQQRFNDGSSSNGRTVVFGAIYQGSNP